MVRKSERLLENREHAARLLAIKIANYKDSNAIVVGVGSGGASVGSSLARELNLKFEVVLCRSVLHPANSNRTIGSVSDGVVVLDDNVRDLPQDFLMRTIAGLRLELAEDYRLLYGDGMRPSFKYKTVIAVADILTTPNNLLAGLKVIQAQNPMKVIVVVPLVEPRVAAEIAGIVNDLIFIQMSSGQVHERDIYANWLPIDLLEIRNSITSNQSGFGNYALVVSNDVASINRAARW